MPCNYAEYPPDWEETRERILTRAKHCCEECGAPNYSILRKSDRVTPGEQEWDMFKAKIRNGYSRIQAMRKMRFTQIILTIAHLDHDKDNWEVTDERLRAWCQKCHLSYDRTRHIDNRKYGRNWRKDQLKLNF